MLKKHRPLESGEFIVVGADTAAGGNDNCCAQFISKTKIDVPWVYHSPNLATEMTNDLHPILEEIYQITNVKPEIAYERNNGGLFEMERLATLNRAGKYKLFLMPNSGRVEASEAVKYGYDTNTATRPKMLSDLKEAIDKRVLTIYDKATIEEMFAFVVVKTSSSWKAQAEDNAHDDRVMSLAIAWQLYQICQPEYYQDHQIHKIYNQLLNDDQY